VGTGIGANGCVEDVCAACSAFATCTPGGSPVCACSVGFTGDGILCRDVDECAPGGTARCGQHMECANLFGSYQCVCAGAHHFDGDACVANASAFSRAEGEPRAKLAWNAHLAGPAPRDPLLGHGSASGGGCAMASAAGPEVNRSRWLWLIVAATAIARSRRRRGMRLLGAGAMIVSGCGGDDPDSANPSGGTGGAAFDAGTGGASTAGASTSGAGGGAAVLRHCELSRDCAAGEWCNPNGEACQLRDSPGNAYTFQDIHEVIQLLTCPTCHRPGGEADFATTGTNLGPLLMDDFELAYRHLLSGGVSCQTSPHRLCVEEPRASLLITKVFAGLNETQELVVFRDWSDDALQKILRWIASGAPRRGPSCGNREVDVGEQCDLGLDPPARCAYGEATCALCTPRCTLAPPVAGPRCGDGAIDDGHETCDEGNAVTEVAGPNGGAVCGNQCTFVLGL
jgi:hypothetical protein